MKIYFKKIQESLEILYFTALSHFLMHISYFSLKTKLCFDQNTPERLFYKMKTIFKNIFKDKISRVEHTEWHTYTPTDTQTDTGFYQYRWDVFKIMIKKWMEFSRKNKAPSDVLLTWRLCHYREKSFMSITILILI